MPLNLGPLVPHILKNGGDWSYQVRTLKPHNAAGSLGKHVATVNKFPTMSPISYMNLFAAAPDLLAALQELLDQLEGIGIPDWAGAEGLTLEQARAAIAKACVDTNAA